MVTVKPGQIWERRATAGAPWRPVRVENVLANEVELRYLDLPAHNVLNFQQVCSTTIDHMLGGLSHGQSEYRFVRDA